MQEPDWAGAVAEGWALQHRPDALLSYFHRLAEAWPNSGRANFEWANALDFCDHEGEAVPVYQRALSLGLGSPYDFYALVQLGSSLRNLGRTDEALATLARARELQPDAASGLAFWCLARASAGEPLPALADALAYVLEHAPEIERTRYGRTLRHYLEDLARL
jgi:cyanophycin synthetase